MVRTYYGARYYEFNAQGDVVALYDGYGALLGTYAYDSWGKLLSVTDPDGNALTSHADPVVANPIRYRGYYYDTETGFYYLNSRYYDPETRRFVNADDYASTGQGFIGFNMYAYCLNNPIVNYDPTGTHSGKCMNGFVVPGSSGYWVNYGYSKDVLHESNTIVTNPNTTVVESNTVSVETPGAIVNSVNMTHVTTNYMLNGGYLIGNIGVSVTTTKQDKEPGLLYSFSDVGNDASTGGFGMNLLGWLGVDVGVSSEINAFVGVQVTPWVHAETSIGLDGIGAVIGVDAGDTSFDFEVKGGWGLLCVLIAPQLLGGGSAVTA